MTATGSGWHATVSGWLPVAIASADLVDDEDRQSRWPAVAAGVVDPCATGLPALHQIDPGRSGRALLCPDPGQVFADTATPQALAGADGDLPAGVAVGDPLTVNGLTGVDCRAGATACGLDPVAFADGGSPLVDCTDGSCPAVESLLPLEADPAVCGDGWQAVRDGGTYDTSIPGVDLGCVTRGELFDQVVQLLDGDFRLEMVASVPQAGQAAADELACTDVADHELADLAAYARLEQLGWPVQRASAPGDVPSLCALELPARRGELYALAAAAAGLAEVAPTTVAPVDVADRHLGLGPDVLPADYAGLVAAAVDAGLPTSVDDCPDGSGRACVQPDVTVTVGQVAEVLSELLVAGW